MTLLPRSVVARAPLHEQQPRPGVRTIPLRHQLDPHLDPLVGIDCFHLAEEPEPQRRPAVIYVFEASRGALRCGDGRIAPGAVAWLGEDVRPDRAGVDCHGVRLLVDRRLAPERSQVIEPARIPEIAARGYRVRILSGGALGVRSPLGSPLTVLDVHLDPHAELVHIAPAAHHAWAVALVGDGFAGPARTESALRELTAVAFASDGDAIRIRANGAGLHALVGHAQPLTSPAASRERPGEAAGLRSEV
jgi:hypothetical protein